MSEINSSVTELDTALKSLRLRWASTSVLWNDSVSQSFETKYLNTIEHNTQAILNEMHRLAQLIADARRQVK